MVFIHHEKKAVFIHNPKCGGAYVRDVLLSDYGFQPFATEKHANLADFMDTPDPIDPMVNDKHTIRKQGKVRYFLSHQDTCFSVRLGECSKPFRRFSTGLFVRASFDCLCFFMKKLIDFSFNTIFHTTQKMNLFILSLCFRECAEALFDKHVSKILLEAVQMLCTAKRILHPDHNDEEFRLYKIAHKNHPVTVWMRQSYENYCWTLQLVEAMHEEWKYRYNHPAEKQHKSFVVALYLKEHAPQPHEFPQQGLTPFALAMPEEYKSADPVASYRLYYQSQEKQKIASWKNREKPDWYISTNPLLNQ